MSRYGAQSKAGWWEEEGWWPEVLKHDQEGVGWESALFRPT
jgi:hypothetical protein